MELNAQMVKGFAPRAARYEVKDDKHPLVVIVQPSGTKSYVCRFNGKRVALGLVEGLTLTQARSLADDTASDLRNGREPRHAMRIGVRALPKPRLVPKLVPASEMTVAAGWSLYMEREGENRKSSLDKWRFYRRDIHPQWGERALLSITRADCELRLGEIHRAILAKGRDGVYANRCHAMMSRFFNWCAKQGHEDTALEISPMVNVSKRVDEKGRGRKRPLSERELIWLFAALPSLHVARAKAIECLLRSVCRRSDIFLSQHNWLSGERLMIPRTKNDQPFLVYLHPSMLALIDPLPQDAPITTRLFDYSDDWLGHGLDELRIEMNRLARLEGFNGDFSS